MTKDEIQFWMLIAFAVAFVLSSYKVYILFSAPAEGLDTQTQYDQLEDIILDFLRQSQIPQADSATIYKSISLLPILQEEQYKNFNQNRFNQLLQQLYLTYEVTSLSELIKSVQSEQ